MRPNAFVTGTLTIAVVILVWALIRDVTREGGQRTGDGPMDTGGRRLAWIDRDGRETPIPAPARAYAYPRLSPDGRLLALDIRDEPDGLWLWDFARQTLMQVSVSRASDIAPVWTYTGDRILFARGRGVAPGLWTVPVRRGEPGGSASPHGQDGTGPTRVAAESNSLLMPTSFLPDDRHLLVTSTAASGFDILMLDLRGDGRPTSLVATTADDLNAEASPDGQWIAYQSRRSGRSEIWLRPLWDGAPDVQVTTDGGTRPAWTKGGRELVYLDADGRMVSRSLDPSIDLPVVGRPGLLFAVDLYSDLAGRTYDVTPDGQRFVVIRNR